jgi:phosphotriesterase-related protein
MSHVQTVLGPIDPAELGWTLPHEHTAIALWHIPNRWDYWELRRDEPIITDELAAFRAAGGGAVVDLTLDGVGRDPDWLVNLSHTTGLHLVMGAGWYRGAHYPPEALIDRRSVAALADVIERDATVGVGETGVRAGIIGEIGVDKPWLSAQEERVHRAAARAARRTGLAITTHAVQSLVGLDQLDVFEA